jgi:O-succinylhomoserine sulfhydrylase
MTKRSRPFGYQDPVEGESPSWDLHPETLAIRAGLSRTGFEETSEALFMNSGFTYSSAEQAALAFKEQDDHYLYSRFGNPTVAMFEQRLAALEGADGCIATSSGMSAMFSSIACLVSSGDRVVASAAMFSSCYYVITEILPKWGVEVVLVSASDEQGWKEALSKPTKAVFIETPSNPLLEIIDIAKVSELAHKAGATVIVDNVMASPVLQNPIALGADVVMYSTTKHIDGQGRALGGAILGSKKYLTENLMPFFKHTGPSMSAFTAWLMLKSLETLHMRVTRMSETADQIARHFENYAGIKKISYPFLDSHAGSEIAKKQMTGGGSTMALEFDAPREKVYSFMNELKVIDISNNLGDSKSLITHPSSTTHKSLGYDVKLEMGISDSTCRLSVGLEHPKDLIQDLELALKKF